MARTKPRHRSAFQAELRYFKAEGLEIREQKKTDELILSGYPCLYETEYSVVDALGRFTEVIASRAATPALGAGADIRFLFDHSGLPLARSTSGTMTLTDSDTKLRAGIRLDARQQLANDLWVAISRGDVSQMSIGFALGPGDDEWTKDEKHRRIFRFRRLLDVSAVAYPASPSTSIAVRAVPVQSRARARRLVSDLRSGRAVSAEQLRSVASVLGAALEVGDAPARDVTAPRRAGPTVSTKDLRARVERAQRARRKNTAAELQQRFAAAKRRKPML